MQKTNFDFEILIRDDFSNDGSDEIIEKIAHENKNVRYFKSNENIGGHKNIKFLLDLADSEYIAYLDGDDYWTASDKLQKQIDFLDANPEYSMCFCGYWRQREFDKSSINLNVWEGPNFYESDDFSSDDFFGNNPVNSLTRVFRNRKGIFKDYFLDCFINDLPLNYEISKIGKIKFLNFPGGVYREHAGSASSLHGSLTEIEFKNLLDKTLFLMKNN